MMRPISSMVVVAAVAAACGCSSTTSTTERERVFGYKEWRQAVEERHIDPEEAVFPFAKTPEIEAWTERLVSRQGRMEPTESLRRLQQTLFDDKAFPFEYEERLTLTAGEAFVQRRGNCMAFTALFIALSRSMGMNTYLLSVTRAPEVEKEESLVVVNRHVVAGYSSGGQKHLFDFYLTSETAYTTHRVVDDLKASAMYHTNLGAAAIRDRDLENAIHHLELAVLLEPRLPAAWVNLGVARFRAGDTEGALEAYGRVLVEEPLNSSALTNMAFVYRKLGMKDEARAALLAAAHGHASPFTLIALADAEMARGNLDQARGYLYRARRHYRKEPEVYDALARFERRRGDTMRAGQYEKRAEKLRRIQVSES